MEGQTENRPLAWPAILRHSGHYRSKAYWIGVKNWTDEDSTAWDYYVSMTGPRSPGAQFFTPITTESIAKFEPTTVIVDGDIVQKNPVIVDKIDPELAADRVLYQRYRSNVGIETERWVYAYAHETFDDFHIIKRRMTNTGNIDTDSEIELPGQTLNEVYFANFHRWVGRSQAAWSGTVAQSWGKFNMVDIVGDGHQDYLVDFTAIYLWTGYDPDYSSQYWDNLGSPMINPNRWTTAGDTTGRLAGMSMQGRIVLHADDSPEDSTYRPEIQPASLGWTSSDCLPTCADGISQHDLYEIKILTRENPKILPGGSSRMYPHYADRVEPSGEFWDPTFDAGGGDAGGKTATVAYGPYQLAFGESINIVEAEGAAGLSYEAASHIGAAFKRSGFDRDFRIAFDANGDGIIEDIPWNYDVYKNGSEVQTKNQWFLTTRDSMFQFMYRARDLWEASAGMRKYPIIEPPRPPNLFIVSSKPTSIDLSWETIPGTPDPEQWAIYRTSEYVDNLPYEEIVILPGTARSFIDVNLMRGVDYYYYLQAIGPKTPFDDQGINGTRDGRSLRSGRYFTQTYEPATLQRQPGAQVSDFVIAPNPVNDGPPWPNRVDFLDIPGQCIISIYTEVGELVRKINHTDGTGFETWDLLTTARQQVAAGIYLVHVRDTESGASDSKKLIVLR